MALAFSFSLLRTEVLGKDEVFTHYLLQALSGQADRDGKGFVSVDATYIFVNNAVKAWAEQNHKSQRPTRKLEADGDMILMRYS